MRWQWQCACAWLALGWLLPCSRAVYKEGDQLTALDYNRAYPVLASRAPGVPIGSMFRFRDFHGTPPLSPTARFLSISTHRH